MKQETINRLSSVLNTLYENNNIGSASYHTLLKLVEEAQTVDWDGKEKLRRNHRVKRYNHASSYIIADVSYECKEVVIRSEHDSNKQFYVCNMSDLRPAKTEVEILFEKWISSENGVVKTVSFSESRLIEFANFVLEEKGK